ncbi:MAG: aminomethyl-transferring glycine dehydrogenase subunit GcvPB [Thermoplasmata archaeon]|nr:MAG: aminomethyl-transferring glycine dehydrogenase subunit GcvPB [Thermoplasmata archaeon]
MRPYRQASHPEPLIFEIPEESRTFRIPGEEEVIEDVPEALRREDIGIPDHPEWVVVRHFTRLSQMNYGVDSGLYPLGSCTMKFNPKLAELVASWPEVQYIHPLQDESTVQGALRIMYEVQEWLKEISGMDAVSLQPAAGAHGEFTGVLIAKKFHEVNGEGHRDEVVLPDSAHGTNPASATMAGYKVVEVPSREDGTVDLEALEAALSERTALFMITNPNTLGIFEDNILEIARMVHEVGALLYYDGANFNAILGKTKPGLMGFDIVHFNLHKTFGTPHGGGGPGSGPVGVTSRLREFLPVPIVEFDGKRYYLNYELKHSIGKVRAFHGNFAVVLRAWVYMRMMGSDGLEWVANRSVLNSNYLKERIKEAYPHAGKELKKHEFVATGEPFLEHGVKTLDIAKRIADYGLHAPTIYFPLIVHEALMIEPTETASKAELDAYADAMLAIAREAKENPEILKQAPHNAASRRIDDYIASKFPTPTWRVYRTKTKDKLKV